MLRGQETPSHSSFWKALFFEKEPNGIMRVVRVREVIQNNKETYTCDLTFLEFIKRSNKCLDKKIIGPVKWQIVFSLVKRDHNHVLVQTSI